jgi:hypothetical protein
LAPGNGCWSGKPANLREHTLIGYVPEFIFFPELNYLDEVETGLEANLRSTSIIMQQRMIAEGARIEILLDVIGRHEPGLMPLMTDRVEITRSFSLVLHEDLARLPRIDSVAKWLQERVASTKAE